MLEELVGERAEEADVAQLRVRDGGLGATRRRGLHRRHAPSHRAIRRPCKARRECRRRGAMGSGTGAVLDCRRPSPSSGSRCTRSCRRSRSCRRGTTSCTMPVVAVPVSVQTSAGAALVRRRARPGPTVRVPPIAQSVSPLSSTMHDAACRPPSCRRTRSTSRRSQATRQTREVRDRRAAPRPSPGRSRPSSARVQALPGLSQNAWHVPKTHVRPTRAARGRDARRAHRGLARGDAADVAARVLDVAGLRERASALRDEPALVAGRRALAGVGRVRPRMPASVSVVTGPVWGVSDGVPFCSGVSAGVVGESSVNGARSELDEQAARATLTSRPGRRRRARATSERSSAPRNF